MARLKEQYKAEVAPALMKQFGYKSVMQIPKIDKVVINVGCGEARENAKVLDNVVGDLGKITGQKAVDLGGLVGDHADLNPIQIGKRLAVLAAAIVVGVGFQCDADALNIFRDLERAGAAGVAGQVLSTLRQGGGGDHQTGIVGKVHDEG